MVRGFMMRMRPNGEGFQHRPWSATDRGPDEMTGADRCRSVVATGGFDTSLRSHSTTGGPAHPLAARRVGNRLGRHLCLARSAPQACRGVRREEKLRPAVVARGASQTPLGFRKGEEHPGVDVTASAVKQSQTSHGLPKPGRDRHVIALLAATWACGLTSS